MIRCPNYCIDGKVKHYPNTDIALYNMVKCPYCKGKGKVTEQEAIKINKEI